MIKYYGGQLRATLAKTILAGAWQGNKWSIVCGNIEDSAMYSADQHDNLLLDREWKR